MWITSGSLSTYGEFAKQGLDLAVEELNGAGGILGRAVEAKIENEGTADNAVRVARRFAIDENVDFLIGLDSSGVAEAVVPTLKELKKILMITHAATPRVTGDLCNKYVFRMSVNVPQNSASGARIAASEIKAKRWTNIGPDYAFGRQSWDFFKKELKKLQPDVVFLDDQAQWPKLGNEDFTSFISKLQATQEADAIWSSTWGNDLVNLVRQGNQFGLFKKERRILFELGAAMEVLETLGDQMPTGMWVGTRYWWKVPDTDTNKKFVDAFVKKYSHYPSYNAQNAYTGMKLLAAAAEKAKSVDTDKLIGTLEDFDYTAPMGRIKIRKEDHQALAQGVWGRTAADAKFKFRVLEPITTFKPEEITPPVADTGCKL
jgi:branched-chain amino acid transport system substrate-binding protein